MSKITEFENAVADYTSSPYAVGMDSCTSCIYNSLKFFDVTNVVLPRQTFISIYTHAVLARAKVQFTDNHWESCYKIEPTEIYDCAKKFESKMYVPGTVMCLSFGKDKPLSIFNENHTLRGGMLLTDNKDLATYARDNLQCTIPRTRTCERNFFNLQSNQSMVEAEADIGLHLLETQDKFECGEITWEHYSDLSEFKLLKIKDRVKIISHSNKPSDRWILDNAKYISSVPLMQTMRGCRAVHMIDEDSE